MYGHQQSAGSHDRQQPRGNTGAQHHSILSFFKSFLPITTRRGGSGGGRGRRFIMLCFLFLLLFLSFFHFFRVWKVLHGSGGKRHKRKNGDIIVLGGNDDLNDNGEDDDVSDDMWNDDDGDDDAANPKQNKNTPKRNVMSVFVSVVIPIRDDRMDSIRPILSSLILPSQSSSSGGQKQNGNEGYKRSSSIDMIIECELILVVPPYFLQGGTIQQLQWNFAREFEPYLYNTTSTQRNTKQQRHSIFRIVNPLRWIIAFSNQVIEDIQAEAEQDAIPPAAVSNQKSSKIRNGKEGEDDEGKRESGESTHNNDLPRDSSEKNNDEEMPTWRKEKKRQVKRLTVPTYVEMCNHGASVARRASQFILFLSPTHVPFVPSKLTVDGTATFTSGGAGDFFRRMFAPFLLSSLESSQKNFKRNDKKVDVLSEESEEEEEEEMVERAIEKKNMIMGGGRKKNRFVVGCTVIEQRKNDNQDDDDGQQRHRQNEPEDENQKESSEQEEEEQEEEREKNNNEHHEQESSDDDSNRLRNQKRKGRQQGNKQFHPEIEIGKEDSLSSLRVIDKGFVVTLGQDAGKSTVFLSRHRSGFSVRDARVQRRKMEIVQAVSPYCLLISKHIFREELHGFREGNNLQTPAFAKRSFTENKKKEEGEGGGISDEEDGEKRRYRRSSGYVFSTADVQDENLLDMILNGMLDVAQVDVANVVLRRRITWLEEVMQSLTIRQLNDASDELRMALRQGYSTNLEAIQLYEAVTHQKYIGRPRDDPNAAMLEDKQELRQLPLRYRLGEKRLKEVLFDVEKLKRVEEEKEGHDGNVPISHLVEKVLLIPKQDSAQMSDRVGLGPHPPILPDEANHFLALKLKFLCRIIEEQMDLIQVTASIQGGASSEEVSGLDLSLRLQRDFGGRVLVTNALAMFLPHTLPQAIQRFFFRPFHPLPIFPVSHPFSTHFLEQWESFLLSLHASSPSSAKDDDDDDDEGKKKNKKMSGEGAVDETGREMIASSNSNNNILLRVVWDAFCCSCCGFSNEMVHFIVPLQQRYRVSVMPGPSCFCPGFPGAVIDTMSRLHWTKDMVLMHSGQQQRILQQKFLSAVEKQGEKKKQKMKNSHQGGNEGQQEEADLIKNFAVVVGQEDEKMDAEEEKRKREKKMLLLLHHEKKSMKTLKSSEKDEVLIWISHTDPMSYVSPLFEKTKPSYVIGRSMYEFSKIDSEWVRHANNPDEVDEIWVPADFVKKVFVKSGVDEKKLFVVPEAVDSYFYDPKAQEQVELPPVRRRILGKTAQQRKRDFYISAGKVKRREENDNDDDDDERRVQSGEKKGDFESQKIKKKQKVTWRHWCNHAPPEAPKNKNKNGGTAPFAFFSSFKWEPRKGWETLFEAYFRTFNSEDYVSLYILTHVWFSGSVETWGDRGNITKIIVDIQDAFFTKKISRKNMEADPTIKADDVDDDDGIHEDANTAGAVEEEDPEEKGEGGIENGRRKDGNEGISSNFRRPKFFRPRGRRHHSDETTSRRQPIYSLLDLALPHFCIITEDLTETQVAQLYNSVDAFVLPTRGEGWGLPSIQAMSMGLPTITTFWGGQMDFLTPQNSFRIPIDALEEVDKDSVYRWRLGKKWAIPSLKKTMEYMALVYEKPAYAKRVGRRARRDVVANFSEEAVLKRVDERLKRVKEIVAERLQQQTVVT